MDDTRLRCANIFYAYRARIISYEEFKGLIKVIDDEVENKQTSLPLKKKEDIMIHFYHNKKKVCSMPTAGLTFPMISAGRELVAKKLKINTFNIEVKYNKGDV